MTTDRPTTATPKTARWAVGLAVICLMVWAAPPAEADEITECDRLVAHPLDPDRVSDGVSRSDVDVAAATAACEAAVTADPDNARLAYQLGRVYFYGGRVQDAAVQIERSAGQGYRQAQFVLGAIIGNRREGAPADVCRVEDLWFKSALQGRLAAQVSYVRHVTKGLFDGCTIQATGPQLTAFIADAQARVEDYYQRLLVADLTEDVAAYVGGGTSRE